MSALAEGSTGTNDATLASGAERVLLDLRPSPWMIVLRPLPWLAFCGIGAVLAVAAGRVLPRPLSLGWLAVCLMIVCVVLVAWNAAVWRCRRCILTERRAIAHAGVVRTLVVDVPLSSIQHAVLQRTARERVIGLGTIGLSTAADAGGFSIVWSMIPNSDEVLVCVRCALVGHRGGACVGGAIAGRDESPIGQGTEQSMAVADIPRASPGAERRGGPVVIGLAGGIGAGKSYVARVFADFGCRVIDSDRLSRAALDRPDVRERLVEWWGRSILTHGVEVGGAERVDRSKVASIVFNDPEQRARLEALIHPIVRQDRAAMVAETVQATGGQRVRAVVVDAPLLFEAGIDKECDAVVFVDTPFEERLERVRTTRGWTKEELERRESAQWSLEKKRSRCRYSVDNSGAGSAGGEGRIRAQVERVLADLTGG